MSDSDYTMKEMLERQYTEIQSLHSKMDSVRIQTTKTNGRVTILEDTVCDHTKKIDKLSKAVAYGTALISIMFIIAQNFHIIKSIFV